MEKNKILIVLGGFFPAQTYGGPTVSIDNLCSLLYKDYDFYILTSDHELNQKTRLDGISKGWNRRGNCSVMYLNHIEENSVTYNKVVDTLQPSMIYINSLFLAKRAVPFLKIAKKKQIPLLLAPRGELCVNAFNKQYKKIPYLLYLWYYLHAKNVWFQSTSDEEDDRISKILHVDSKRIFRLTNVPHIPSDKKNKLIKEAGKCNLVFLSRLEAKKNLHYAIQCLKEVKSNITFDIYGPKEDLEYWNKCEKLISQLPENVQVNYKGAVLHDQVNQVLSEYHGFLFPTLSENYGHVIVESMLAGCPVITSDQVPWIEINDNKAGWCIQLTQQKKFTDIVENLAEMPQKDYDIIVDNCLNFIKKSLDIDATHESYYRVFKMLTERNK